MARQAVGKAASTRALPVFDGVIMESLCGVNSGSLSCVVEWPPKGHAHAGNKIHAHKVT